ncbi:FAD-binding oxidoreductase [Pseudonocardiaceae bacterium YIM PH 21723]|nr:FAD-binding oxidoreductase [Pseudonocardiaceae bacterium YIM PH 21723]
MPGRIIPVSVPFADDRSTKKLAQSLSARVDGDVLFDPASRALYSTDASNYRRIPLGVVRPRHPDAVIDAMAVAAEFDVPITTRGAGTSVAGNACGAGLIIDLQRHCDRITEIDPDRAVAVVQPGVVLDDLQREAARHGLMFGPDPSTHSRCTLGGMIGNDACGAHSVAYGRTSDNVLDLDVLTYTGQRFHTSGFAHPSLTSLQGLMPPPTFSRRVSGYQLDALPDVTRALIGTEGTCVTVLGATLRLHRRPAARALAVLAFADRYGAADHGHTLRGPGVLTIEGLDDRLVALSRNAGLLPPGNSWLLVETGGESLDEARELAASLSDVVLHEPEDMRALWKIREEGAGLATRMGDGGEAWSGWEDAAVPPERLGAYLREFDELLRGHGRRGVSYGHFGEGCLHVRIDFDLRAGYRAFLEDAADLVVAHGGSLSGEHGDGHARSALLPRMYSPAVLDGFRRFKAVFDPRGRMNPGIIVDPLPVDEDLRIVVAPPRIPHRTELTLPADGGDLAAATRRCVGVGKCVASEGGMMCPSYRATGEEKHSTRGRARLLFEMLSGSVITGGWRSPEVREALDLCLACKACKRDCPVDVDMATYKAEFLHRHYRRRPRPLAHYSMGRLPLWLRLARSLPGLVNRLSGTALLRRLGGIDPARAIPQLAEQNLQNWWQHRRRRRTGTPIQLLPDTFTNYFDPQTGRDAVAVLEHLGFAVHLPPDPVCCGLTWYSTGQFAGARRQLRRLAAEMVPGVPLVGLEPSCTAFLKHDAPQLCPDDPAVAELSESVRTFGETVRPLLAASPPFTTRRRAVVQQHCHSYAELSPDADRQVLAMAGVTADVLDSGCCGLAGNFGFENGHHSLSLAVAEQELLPAVRAAAPETAIVADGFSCRTQLRECTDREPVHLASLLVEALELKA